MRKFVALAASALLLNTATGCEPGRRTGGGSSPRSGAHPGSMQPGDMNPQNPMNPDGTQATLTTLNVALGQASLVVGNTMQLTATGQYSDGQSADVSAQVAWSSSRPAVATVDAGVITAVAQGMTTISAELNGVTATADLQILPDPMTPVVTLVELELTAAATTLSVGATSQLTATSVYSDGSRTDATVSTTWTSRNPSAAPISPSGLVTAAAAGSAIIEATLQGLTRRLTLTIQATDPGPGPGPCSYPAGAGSSIQFHQVMPRLFWQGAVREDGSTFDLDLEQIHCDASFANVETIHFIIGAGWCPNCPAYMRRVSGLNSAIEAAGGMVVWVQIETENRTPANNQQAATTVNREAPGAVGPRVGDADTQPLSQPFGRAVSGVPSAIIVRTSDMVVIADQRTTRYQLPFDRIAQSPELDWTDPTNPGMGTPTPGMANCGAMDEEMYEPNDAPAQAGALAAGATFAGGICASQPDFYQITHTGAWQLDLEFVHAVGDLDVYVFDTTTNQPMRDAGGNVIGSDSTTDNESFTHSGPALVIVSGYQGATSPYRLTITGH